VTTVPLCTQLAAEHFDVWSCSEDNGSSVTFFPFELEFATSHAVTVRDY
jgi:hypothetical protein